MIYKNEPRKETLCAVQLFAALGALSKHLVITDPEDGKGKL